MNRGTNGNGVEEKVRGLENFALNGVLICLTLRPVSKYHIHALQRTVLEDSGANQSFLSNRNTVVLQQYRDWKVRAAGELVRQGLVTLEFSSREAVSRNSCTSCSVLLIHVAAMVLSFLRPALNNSLQITLT